MNRFLVYTTSPIWLFLALTNFLDYRNLVKSIKESYKGAVDFPENLVSQSKSKAKEVKQ